MCSRRADTSVTSPNQHDRKTETGKECEAAIVEPQQQQQHCGDTIGTGEDGQYVVQGLSAGQAAQPVESPQSRNHRQGGDDQRVDAVFRLEVAAEICRHCGRRREGRCKSGARSEADSATGSSTGGPSCHGAGSDRVRPPRRKTMSTQRSSLHPRRIPDHCPSPSTTAPLELRIRAESSRRAYLGVSLRQDFVDRNVTDGPTYPFPITVNKS